MPRRSPTVRRRRLGIELRQLRDRKGLTIEQVARQLECSDSKISRIETAQVSPTPRDVRDMLAIYGVEGEQRESLIEMAREARQKGWWHRFTGVPVDLVGLETAATSIRSYQVLCVPGLFQTEEYAREVLAAVKPKLPREERERRLELRMARQTLLTQEDAPAFWVVIDEGALRRVVGGREVMRQQLERLVEAADLPTVTLQVLPFSVGAHAGMDGVFTIIGFPEGDPDVVYLENTTGDLYLEDPETIRQYALLFDHLRAAASRPADAPSFFTQLAKDL